MNSKNNYSPPFGKEWEKEMMKATKKRLIDKLREKCIELEQKNNLIQMISLKQNNNEKL